MRNICMVFIHTTLTFGGMTMIGCSTNHAQLVHGILFSEIEETVQSQLQQGMPMEDAKRVAEVVWSLSKAKIIGEYSEDAWYSLEPIISSSFLFGEHRSSLHLVSDKNRLDRVIYVNYWMLDDVPYGRTEIPLSEATP